METGRCGSVCVDRVFRVVEMDEYQNSTDKTVKVFCVVRSGRKVESVGGERVKIL